MKTPGRSVVVIVEEAGNRANNGFSVVFVSPTLTMTCVYNLTEQYTVKIMALLALRYEMANDRLLLVMLC
ncbi:uncharacterized protein PHALS_05900 [Plasmopara halstedii]|uniref:Uncharacterized protein n=1 Tax=Plasmopara halstedii TaxID=4781 RepID=A0A0P1ABS8_PLAHL|nr:uncharacterized protein PHALS_05900 [Plasmopara halstedii]CEG37847.1 hypothetical protein PHALS_05900 [Plasmopara halstedii]|eukprot:XP_024574216.1 hypothetical protein PHALS_05900 [Plasmopara halstedii]